MIAARSKVENGCVVAMRRVPRVQTVATGRWVERSGKSESTTPNKVKIERKTNTHFKAGLDKSLNRSGGSKSGVRNIEKRDIRELVSWFAQQFSMKRSAKGHGQLEDECEKGRISRGQGRKTYCIFASAMVGKGRKILKDLSVPFENENFNLNFSSSFSFVAGNRFLGGEGSKRHLAPESPALER